MKALIFLALFVAALALVVWKVRKSHAEAAQARRKELARRRKRAKEVVTPELHMTWPVIIRPATGNDPSDTDSSVEEPAMTSIEYEPPERAAS